MVNDFDNRIRQVFFLIFIIAIALLLFAELYVFFPGFLGALTLYILSRKPYFFLTHGKKWNKSATALLFMLLFLICVAAPVYFCFQMLYSKIVTLIQHPEPLTKALNAISVQVKQWIGQDLLSMDAVKTLPKQIGRFIPMILNGSATMLGNLLMILFLSFFMFTNGPELEKVIRKFVPLKPKNIDLLADETVMMVKANAMGIPLISLVQGLFAMAGYWIFGIDDFVLLGLLTGIFAFFPVVGTAVIWLPVVVTLFSSGENGKAIGLAIYSLVVTGNIDYVARITFLKKVGNVPPVITILGLIVGLKLFGFWGFIFGPLLISYFLLLVKIYQTEFSAGKTDAEDITAIKKK